MSDVAKKLAAILEEYARWRGRVGVKNQLFALTLEATRKLHGFLEGAFLSGYMQALIDHGLPTGALTEELEQRADVPEGP